MWIHGTEMTTRLVNLELGAGAHHHQCLLSFLSSRITDPYFDGVWTPEEYYLDLELSSQYARALYFALVIMYGNDLSETSLS